MVTIPHAGEKVPDVTSYLRQLPEAVLMGDVDRYVDQLYAPTVAKNQIPKVQTEWHRYAADLNRLPSDTDADSLQGSPNPSGQFSRGFHWSLTTHREKLMPQPLSLEQHTELVNLIFNPFHQGVRELAAELAARSRHFLHLDLHSMPSLGTSEHRDPGEQRADIVISDSRGKSCASSLRDLVIVAYVTAGFKVAYNWPYYGGRITEQYGRPETGHHCIQVELNRALYMNEKTKAKGAGFVQTQEKLDRAMAHILTGLQSALAGVSQ